MLLCLPRIEHGGLGTGDETFTYQTQKGKEKFSMQNTAQLHHWKQNL